MMSMHRLSYLLSTNYLWYPPEPPPQWSPKAAKDTRMNILHKKTSRNKAQWKKESNQKGKRK